MGTEQQPGSSGRKSAPSAFKRAESRFFYGLRRKRAVGAWLLVFALLPGRWLEAAPLLATADQASTLQDTAVTIPVLANDQETESNQLAILQVTPPAHGSVLVNSNGLGANAELARLFQFVGLQLSNTVVQVGATNLYPRSAPTNGLWRTYPIGINNWVSGFFPGCLWSCYEQSGDPRYRSWAENWTAGIAPMQSATETDDVSFMVNTSFGAGYRLTGNPSYLPVLLQGAQSIVAVRYNPVVGCIGAAGDNNTFDVKLDTMMNLALLFRAAALGGDPSLSTKAFNHARQTMLNHVRADSSTYHIVTYNGKTGAVISQGTYAGASDGSTWARGHAWGTYGFTMAYRETGDNRFLSTAQRLADYFLANVPADWVPYWDFQAPGIPNAPRDSSAAAITLSALVELSQVVTNLQDSARYWLGARRLLSSLSSTNYLSQSTTHSGILLHGTGEPPQFRRSEVDYSLIYGDYYFMEALQRYAKTYRRSTLTYIPSPGFQGTDAFTYLVADSAGNCATGTVAVTVEPATPRPFRLQIAAAPDTSWPVLSFPSTAGRSYQVEFLSELGTVGPWSLLASNLAGTGLPLTLTDTNAPVRRFYRAGAQ